MASDGGITYHVARSLSLKWHWHHHNNGRVQIEATPDGPLATSPSLAPPPPPLCHHLHPRDDIFLTPPPNSARPQTVLPPSLLVPPLRPRGNMFLRRSAVGSVKDPATGENVEKAVFVVFYAGERARQKILKVGRAWLILLGGWINGWMVGRDGGRGGWVGLLVGAFCAWTIECWLGAANAVKSIHGDLDG